jgi:hypothetical protein
VIPKAFDQIDKSAVDALVTEVVSEGRSLEYKRDLPGTADNEKREFLADISSFANATGGDLIYGIVDKRDAQNKATGIPDSIVGLAVPNLGAEILRLQEMIRNGCAPRITNVQIKAIAGYPVGPVVVVRIPKSWNAPHMITYQNHARFYSRTSAGKYPLDIAEIRSAFALSQSLPEQVRRFRDERLARIVVGDAPIPITPSAKIVLHLLPAAALDPQTLLDIGAVSHKLNHARPLYYGYGEERFNLDGFLSYVWDNTSGLYSTYLQVFRSSAIEAVDTMVLRPREGDITTADIQMQTDSLPKVIIPGFLPRRRIEEELVYGVHRYITLQKELDVPPPLFVLITLLGVKGYMLSGSSPLLRQHGFYGIDRDVVHLPDRLVEDYALIADYASTARMLRPAFDALYQAAGWSHCTSYDESGAWTAPTA